MLITLCKNHLLVYVNYQSVPRKLRYFEEARAQALTLNFCPKSLWVPCSKFSHNLPMPLPTHLPYLPYLPYLQSITLPPSVALQQSILTLILASCFLATYIKLLTQRLGSDTAIKRAMAIQAEPQYFTKARRAGRIVVDGLYLRLSILLLKNYLADFLKEPPKLDLEAYIANYRGNRPRIPLTFAKVRISNRLHRSNTLRTTSPHWNLITLPLLGSTESSHC